MRSFSQTPSASEPSAAPSRPGGSALSGILWMIVAGLCFVAVTASVKMVGDDVPAAQAAFLRYALGAVFLLPMIPAVRRVSLTRRILKPCRDCGGSSTRWA
jgi:drug/metabolite transporter (DMT)-like permease